jgi:pyridoxal phosphate enzyme (YggS family)
MIKESIQKLLFSLPKEVNLVAATKGRSAEEIKEAISSGITAVGENYVQEAQEKFKIIGNSVKWHLLGHLQKNKVKLAVSIFDMIETLDSLDLAKALDRECKKNNKILPVLIEVNSAGELQKSGVLPEAVYDFAREVLKLDNLKLMGLMTMGPLVDEPEAIRPFFKKTKEIFDKIRRIYPENTDLKYLSMGMSGSYKVAIEEGANIVRIGTAIFGSLKHR